MRNILVVCRGNVCRSPVGERLLRRALPGWRIYSAGLQATPGMSADPKMASLAERDGISLNAHRSQMFTLDLARQHDLILVMKRSHMAQIAQNYPQISGKTFYFNHWPTPECIADPWKKSDEFYEIIYKKIVGAADSWRSVLNK